jgi:probable HAF family extracellular repeat protein
MSKVFPGKQLNRESEFYDSVSANTLSQSEFRKKYYLAILFAIVGPVSTAHSAPSHLLTILDPLGNVQYSSAAAINNSGQIVGYSQVGYTTHAVLWNGKSPFDLGTLLGGSSSKASSINDKGQVVGYSSNASGNNRATLWSDGSTTDLGTLPNGANSYATSINNAGRIAGNSDASNGQTYAVFWNGTTINNLGTFPNSRFGSSATGINNSGQVAGYSGTASDYTQAAVWTDQLISGLEGDYSWAYSINDSGQVAISRSNLTSRSVAIWNGSTVTSLNTLGGRNFSYVTAINNEGHVVGYSQKTVVGPSFRDDNVATLWDGSNVIDLNSLLTATDAAQWLLYKANDINDQGVIVGEAINRSSLGVRGFVLSANSIPAPSTFALLALGFAGVLWSRRRTNTSEAAR